MVTDGSFVCGLCGEWAMGCSLCGVAPLIDMTKIRAKEREDERNAETELWNQEWAIRREAEKRRRD
jgi:hypothetical protein